MKELFNSIFTKEIIIKFLLWTIPWKLVSGGIFIISWWNFILYFFSLYLEEKFLIKFENTPYYIWFILIFIWVIWYFVDKMTNNINNINKLEYLDFKHEYRNLQDKWKGSFTNIDDQELVRKNNIDEIKKILHDNQEQIKQFEEHIDNKNCYLLQLV